MQENKIVLERSENLVYSCLRLQARNLAEICGRDRNAAGEDLSIMAKLQMKGYAKEVYKNYYTAFLGAFAADSGYQRKRVSIMAKNLVIVESPRKGEDHQEIPGLQL